MTLQRAQMNVSTLLEFLTKTYCSHWFGYVINEAHKHYREWKINDIFEMVKKRQFAQAGGGSYRVTIDCDPLSSYCSLFAQSL